MTGQPTAQELLQAARSLQPDELDALVDGVVRLRAHLHAPSVTQRESILLQRINAALPETTWQRYQHLVLLRQAEHLTDAEYAELIRLSDAVDQHHTRRMEALSDLAALRGLSLDDVMHSLGIVPQPYA